MRPRSRRRGRKPPSPTSIPAGRFDATGHLETAQSAWLAYRDAECDRRTSLMFISAESREEIGLDCRITLTRARADELERM